MVDQKTSLSMLDGLRANVPDQWDRFVMLFGPLVYEWCRRAGVSAHDSADVVQEVFKVVAEKVIQFRRDQPGDSFRGWMYGITRIKCQDHFRQLGKRDVATGGSTAHRNLHETAAPDFQPQSNQILSSENAALFHRALELIKTDFETGTWKAFWRFTIDEVPATALTEELGMTAGAIYNAKYKVLRRLKTEFEGLLSVPGEDQKML